MFYFLPSIDGCKPNFQILLSKQIINFPTLYPKSQACIFKLPNLCLQFIFRYFGVSHKITALSGICEIFLYNLKLKLWSKITFVKRYGDLFLKFLRDMAISSIYFKMLLHSDHSNKDECLKGFETFTLHQF